MFSLTARFRFSREECLVLDLEAATNNASFRLTRLLGGNVSPRNGNHLNLPPEELDIFIQLIEAARNSSREAFFVLLEITRTFRSERNWR